MPAKCGRDGTRSNIRLLVFVQLLDSSNPSLSLSLILLYNHTQTHTTHTLEDTTHVQYTLCIKTRGTVMHVSLSMVCNCQSLLWIQSGSKVNAFL